MELLTENVPKSRLGQPLARFWVVLGDSWASLGRLLGALGRLLAPLGHFWNASWASPGRSWALLAWSEAPSSCILALGGALGLDFAGFGAVLGWVLEGS